MKAHSYHPTKLKPFMQVIARMVKNNPALADDPARLWANLIHNMPEIGNKTVCPNCSASMAEYADTLDINDALLIYSMARIIRSAIDKGVPFTDANKLRVSSADIHHTQKCRTTKCSKLGLIAKAGNSQWSITKRGFAALNGQAVPKVRITFRGEILERPEEIMTFAEVFSEHGAKMKARELKRKSLKNDKRLEFEDYDPAEWYTIAGYHHGALL